MTFASARAEYARDTFLRTKWHPPGQPKVSSWARRTTQHQRPSDAAGSRQTHMTSDSAKSRDLMPGSDTPRVTDPMSDLGPDNRTTPEQIPRSRVPALDAILGRPFKVLDDGFVRVLDYMGDDSAVVQAARISYGAGTKKIHEDRGLIRYLMRHRHSTPYEMCDIKFHVRVPMDTWRQ